MALRERGLPLVLQVRLVADEADDDVFLGFLAQHVDPGVEVEEALDLCSEGGYW